MDATDAQITSFLLAGGEPLARRVVDAMFPEDGGLKDWAHGRLSSNLEVSEHPMSSLVNVNWDASNRAKLASSMASLLPQELAREGSALEAALRAMRTSCTTLSGRHFGEVLGARCDALIAHLRFGEHPKYHDALHIARAAQFAYSADLRADAAAMYQLCKTL